MIEVGALRIDTVARDVRVGDTQRRASRRSSTRCSCHLAAEPTRVFTKHELLRDVWGFRAPGRTRTLDTHACRLRHRLTDAGDGRFVENVWGVGYRLVSPDPREPARGGGMTARELERLVRAQRPALVAVARRRAGTREAAEDAVQEALTIAFRNRERIRPETALGYIHVIARHEAGRLRRRTVPTVSLDAPTPSGISRHELVADRRAVDHDAVLDALAALPEIKRDQARALAARMLGWRYMEIADAFGWSYTKTNRCVTEGRAAIRKALGADEPPAAPAAPRQSHGRHAMKRSRLRRTTPLRPGPPPERRTPLARRTPLRPRQPSADGAPRDAWPGCRWRPPTRSARRSSAAPASSACRRRGSRPRTWRRARSAAAITPTASCRCAGCITGRSTPGGSSCCPTSSRAGGPRSRTPCCTSG